MVANYVQLTPFNPGPGINWEPLNNALDSISRQNNANRVYDFQQKQFDANQQQRQFENARATKQDQNAEIKMFGDSAKAFSQLAPDDPTRQNWAKLVQARHPNAANLDPRYLDPIEGPKLVMAEAGQYLDPIDREAKVANLELTRAQTKAATQKNALNDAIAGILSNSDDVGSGAGNALSAPQSRQPNVPPYGGSVQPQSYFGEPPNNALMMYTGGNGSYGQIPGYPNALAPAVPEVNALMPSAPAPRQAFSNGPSTPTFGETPFGGLPDGVLLANDTSPQQARPPAAAQAQPNTVRTPLGQMTKERAQRVGLGLALGGHGDAGKMLVDAANQNALEKGAATENDKNELAATSQMAVLDDIKNSFDSSYLNIPNRFRLWGTALKDKFGTLSEKDQQDLAGYTRFRQTTWQNLNTVLKQLSGTAVTENEMKRQLEVQPNAGTGVADGDSPTEFATKVRGQMAFAQSAIARARWLRKQGFTGAPWEAGVPVEAMPSLIKKRGDELLEQYQQQNPKADPSALKSAVKRDLKQEFGI